MATGSYTCVDDWDSSQKRRKTELIFCAFLTLILVAQSERKLSWSWLQNSQNYTETWKQSHLCHRIALRWAFMQQKVFCSVYTVDCCCQFFPYFFCHNLFWIFWKSLLFLRDCSSFGSNYQQKIVSFYIYVSVQKWTFELYFLTPAVGSSQLLWHFSNQFGLVEKPAT